MLTTWPNEAIASVLILALMLGTSILLLQLHDDSNVVVSQNGFMIGLSKKVKKLNYGCFLCIKKQQVKPRFFVIN